MLQLIVGTAIYILLSATIRAEEVKMDRLQKEYDNTDWNEYYANV